VVWVGGENGRKGIARQHGHKAALVSHTLHQRCKYGAHGSGQHFRAMLSIFHQ
jgi:hypothetical protein